MIIELNKIEVQHLLTLIDVNKRDGWYFGNKIQYWKRSDRLQKVFNQMLENNKQ